MAISGAVYFTGAIPLLVFGLYWKRASKVGAYMSLFCGFLSLLGLPPVQQQLGFEKEVSSAVVGLVTVSLSIVVMVVGSLLFPGNKNAHSQKEQGVN
jgi:Na+/proline symporter